MRKERRLGKWEDKAWKSSMRILLAGLAGLGAEVYAAPFGIVGGQDTSLNAYAALVMQSGALAPVAGLPTLSVINATAMNTSGFSLIGGQDTNLVTAYAATISSTGTLTPLPLVLTGLNPMINSVAINPGGTTGLIGGQASGTGPGFAAFVLPDGTISPAAGFADVTANSNFISSTAINCSSVGLIGGEGVGEFGGPYAAYVATNGTVTPLTITPAYNFEGSINSVAINAQGIGLLGGFANDTGAFAQFVNPSGQILAVFAPAGIAGDGIDGVAVNNAGLGLIGGNVNATFYAAYVTQQGDSTLLGTPITPGSIISSVALNSSGAGIIGGNFFSGPTPYAALVQPDGSATPLNLGVFNGTINSVAISDSGIGLIGGTNQTMSDAYAALVAPNGTVTPLDVSAAGGINGVDVSGKAGCSICEAMTPKSIGPYLSVAYTQLAASYALETRFVQKNCSCSQTSDTPEMPETKTKTKAQSNCKNCNNETASIPAKQNSIWFAPFGNYNHVREQGKIPRYNNQIGGALVGYDHQGSNYLAGASLGYAFNYIGYKKGIGHGKINNEMASIYGSYNREHFRLNGALWGGYYQFRNIRHSKVCSIAITSKAKTHGWTLSPELQIASPWAINQKKCYVAEPFVKFDWFNEWQHRFTETGKAGFNLRVPSIYYSFLQSEAGLRFYETFTYGWGNFCLEEKISYVNQAPFHVHSVNTSFVGATSSFPIEIASSKIENLGAVQLMGSFTPRDSAYPYGGFSLQAMANRTYRSYFASVFVGMDF